jgi:hypothetical protein
MTIFIPTDEDAVREGKQFDQSDREEREERENEK